MNTTEKTIERHPRLIYVIGLILLGMSCIACNAQPKERKFDEQIAADTFRFQSPEGVIQNDERVIEGLTLSLQSESSGAVKMLVNSMKFECIVPIFSFSSL